MRNKKLSSETWKAIREAYEGGQRQVDICAQFGIHRSTLYDKAREQSWVKAAPGESALDEHAAGLVARADEVRREHDTLVKGGDAPVAGLAEDREKANRRHLSMARSIGVEIRAVLKARTIRTCGSPGRLITELTQSLERLQRIERLALAMDQAHAARVPVVILAPLKASGVVWHETAAKVVTEG